MMSRVFFCDRVSRKCAGVVQHSQQCTLCLTLFHVHCEGQAVANLTEAAKQSMPDFVHACWSEATFAGVEWSLCRILCAYEKHPPPAHSDAFCSFCKSLLGDKLQT